MGALSKFKKIFKPVAALGAVAAAPFTGGTSLSWLPLALGGASAASSLLPGDSEIFSPQYLSGLGDMMSRASGDVTVNFPGQEKEKWWQTVLKSGLPAALAGGVLSGIGGAKQANIEAQAARDIATQQLLGPIRGGSTRAGNIGMFGFPGSSLGLNPQDYLMLAEMMYPKRG